MIMSIQWIVVISSAVAAAIISTALWFAAKYLSNVLERIEKEIRNKSDSNKQQEHFSPQTPNHWNAES